MQFTLGFTQQIKDFRALDVGFNDKAAGQQ